MMSSILSIPIDQVHQSLLDISSNPDYSCQIQIQNPLYYPTNLREKWTGPINLPGHIYKLLSHEAKDALKNLM